MGWLSNITGGATDFISDPLADANDTVNNNWVDLRDTAQAAAVVAGNYYLPGSSLLTSKLVTSGAQDKLNSDIGRVANTAAGVAGGVQGNASNYGKLGEAAGLTSGTSSAADAARTAADAEFLAADASQLAKQGLSQAAIEQNLVGAGVNSFAAADAAQLALQGIPPEQMSTMLAQSSGAETIFSNPAVTKSLTANQIAQLAKAGISLAGIAGAANALDGTGGFGLAQQNRSGFSSGSANYSPEYYQQVQNKYNQYMPQSKGADITTDLKNWYETKYTPNVGVSGVPTTTATGTGYTTPTSMTNLGITPQAKTPTPPQLLPSVSALTPTSSATDVAKAFSDWSAANGGNTEANRSTAITYLRSVGIPDSAIQSGYSSYLSALPASTGNTPTSMAANSSAAQIAQAYGTYAANNGGDTEANRSKVITYLRQMGVPDATIQAAYPIYQSSLTPQQGTGMLTGGAAPTTVAPAPMAQQAAPAAAQAPQPLYATLGANSDPQAIANAYSQFLGSSANDTQANQQAANQYLTNLGISQDTIGQAYGLFKG